MKLYAISRANLPQKQQWVQATHAALQFIIDNPSSGWSNGTLVMLKTDDLEGLLMKLKQDNHQATTFFEPYKNMGFTALSGLDIDRYVTDLELI